MNTLLERRRIMMMAEQNPTPQPLQYVSDGLILHLDGIDKGDVAGVWKSLVGGYEFTNDGATFENDHVALDGTDDYLSNSDFVCPDSNVGTIEVVMDRESTGSAQCLFLGKSNGNLCMFIQTAGTSLIYSRSTSRNMYELTNSKCSISVSSSRCYENGVENSALSNTNSVSDSGNTNRIGRRGSGSYYKGKIYSIRIYNKILTAAEILNNYAVDVSRFNL